MKINIFWFRRDLRLQDNTALYHALNSGLPVLPVFIFDTNITDDLPEDDPRLNFIYYTLLDINNELSKYGSSLTILKGDPLQKWEELISSYDISEVFINKDYEPYAIERDRQAESLLSKNKIILNRYKDQVIFEENDILKQDGKPYTVFTPYKKRWLGKFKESLPGIINTYKADLNRFHKYKSRFPLINELHLRESNIKVRPYDLSVISEYDKYRDIPAIDRTSYLSPHLRFGTISIREVSEASYKQNTVFLSELVWREFFMQILFHFHHVVTENFRPSYNNLIWLNDEKEFDRWCRGETGYPIVDAGMRQLNETGYMHNRVRMITAGFLCKHLLIDWRLGEAWFAGKLLDYELSSNNGNWQWAAGTGCDAAPYFRIFNPDTQQKKYDPEMEYTERWVGNTGKSSYPEKMIDHKYARERAISTYRESLTRKPIRK
ncbi:MAG: deoxyribodipyrimidine photo-lyase [Bacteroidetes bacterium]|nr:deoxyribodipyrimidine photo-lyase [Bacteroidota bacterium]